jgi:hypothetical protein
LLFLLANIPQFADMPTMEREINELSKFANKNRGGGPMKQNMVRATEIAADVIKKYNHQVSFLIIVDLRWTQE